MLIEKRNCQIEPNSNTMQISLNELITALAAAFDLAESSERKHSLRTAYVAARLAAALQLSNQERENIYFASLLHDLIPPESAFNQRLIFDILANLPLKPQVGLQVAGLWQYKQVNNPSNICPRQLELEPRLIFLAESFENIYCSSSQDEPLRRGILLSWVKEKVHAAAPDLAAALYGCMCQEAFWQDIKENRIHRAIRSIAPEARQQLDINAIEKVSRSFSLLIDRKNPYTGQHSRRVGMIAGSLARLYGMDSGKVRKISIAGYLHDLGKLSVSEQILNKSAALNEAERQIIKAHPYDSYAVLNEVEGFADIACWAGNHHERMDGSGYPWGKVNLTVEDQIIAVADIYEAMTSDRPYRRALKDVEALNIIKKQAVSGEIMSQIYDLLEEASKKRIDMAL